MVTECFFPTKDCSSFQFHFEMDLYSKKQDKKFIHKIDITKRSPCLVYVICLTFFVMLWSNYQLFWREGWNPSECLYYFQSFSNGLHILCFICNSLVTCAPLRNLWYSSAPVFVRVMDFSHNRGCCKYVISWCMLTFYTVLK